jgi:23S rRNA pseudouridine2605 synthase
VSRAKPIRNIGLARALSKLGYCSRSRASELIRAGRVRLNSVIRRDPEYPVHIERDRLEVDGAVISVRPKTYLMLNKPRGVVTTACDEKGRKTVYACLGDEHSHIAPVGRLDKASEGLLLFSNDSEWAARLLAPETHLERTYHVQVEGIADAELAKSLERGIRGEDGNILRAKAVRILRQGGRNTWLEIVLDEGKNRQIRRMLAHSGLDVLRLVRVAIGSLPLGQLDKGAYRPLTQEEKRDLDRAMDEA